MSEYNNYDSNSPDQESSDLLTKYSKAVNIAEFLDDDELQKCSNKVLAGFLEDQLTQAKWLQIVEDAQRLAKLTKEPKSTPLPQSANIKFPLITNACYQFAARTYPELVQDGKVVKCEVIGQSNLALEAQASRISQHMSYQLLAESSDWEISMDKLLVMLPNIGFLVKKTYYDPLTKRNVSEVCNYKDIVIRNEVDVQSLKDLRRITHILYCHPNDLVENCRSGYYLEKAVDEIILKYSDNERYTSCMVYEQHRFLDLDNDGYEEPYIVTVHKETNKVLRIVARFTDKDIERNDDGKIKRINPIQYFTDYHFLPSPDGCFMSVGFGTLMLHLNETVNTILNQLIDAGTLANMQFGFIDSRLKVQGGQSFQDPGMWNKVKGVIGQNLKDGILPLQYKEPSQVLFQLLGLVIQTAKDLSSSTEVMQGTQPAQNVPATTVLALVEQGMKVFNSIQRRLYRSLKDEYQKIYNLNKLYLDATQYINLIGDPAAIHKDDYDNASIKLIPIADPNLSSDAQRAAKSQFLLNLAAQPATGQYLNMPEIIKRALISGNFANPELLIKPEQQAQAPDPKMVQLQMQAHQDASDYEIKSRQQDLREKEFAAKLAKMEAEIQQMQSKAVVNISQAGKNQHTASMEALGMQVDAVKTQINAAAQAHKQMTDADVAHKQLAIQADQNSKAHQRSMMDLGQSHQREMIGLQQNQQQIDQQAQPRQEAPNAENGNSGMDETSGNA